MKTVSNDKEQKSIGEARSTSTVPGIDTRRGIGGYIAGVQREAKKIAWPTPSETTRLTSTVIGVCVLVAAMLFGFSLLVETILRVLGVTR